MVIKIGTCYIAKFSKVEMPVRIESQKENGIWIARSLTHGRIVFVNNESQILRECNESDLVRYAQTTIPNRRSKKQKQHVTMPQLPTETPVATLQRKVKPKRSNVPEFGLTLIEAAYRVLKEARRPLNSQEIVDMALKKKLHRSCGSTPANTINSAIIRLINKEGDKSRFIKAGRGLFTVR